MSGVSISNVGRNAERIVANELEFLGFEVSELNRDKTAANVDMIALSTTRKFWQIQAKGAANKGDEQWWVQYGNCADVHIADRNAPMFNRSTTNIYKAEFWDEERRNNEKAK
jgi:hypothetical protein